MVRNIGFLILILTFFSSCDPKPKRLGKGDDVIVSLEVTDTANVRKIEFRTKDPLSSEIITAQDLKTHNHFEFGYKNSGESVFFVILSTSFDTLRFENYAEKGYRPKLKCDSKKIETVDPGFIEID